ncbi:MAG: HK97 gp10 family phage protein [Kofleriaceae bacterium]
MWTLEIDESAIAAALAEAEAAIEAGCIRAMRLGCSEGAEAARRDHTFKNHTGTLEKSIGGRLLRVYRAGDGMRVEGALEATAPYASYVNDGTKPHPIQPKGGRGVLRWYDPGGVKFAARVQHPGTEANNFMTLAETRLRAVVEREVLAGAAAAGRILAG